jgi:hypothetical protein
METYRQPFNARVYIIGVTTGTVESVWVSVGLERGRIIRTSDDRMVLPNASALCAGLLVWFILVGGRPA